MANRTKRTTKTKSSIIYCAERYSCEIPNAEAVIICEDCGSNQCSACDRSIHCESKSNHERKPITYPENIRLCSYNCAAKNYANIVCNDCNGKLFCYDCNEVSHPKGSIKHNHSNEILGKSKPLPVNKKESTQNLVLDLNESNTPSLSTRPTDMDGYTDCQFEMDLNSTPQEFKSCLQNKSNVRDTMTRVSVSSVPDLMAHVETEKISCFSLLNQDEEIHIKDKEEFRQMLGCDKDCNIKVVSIFGNTGDGKSHTLNEAFFNGLQIFTTSTEQTSCTAGAWAAFNSSLKAMIVDTEGLLGISANSAKRTRLLLKVLAISDIVIYRTRAERLRDEMYTFLHDSAKAYRGHFKKELKDANKRGHLDSKWCDLGPKAVIFQETQYTNILGYGQDKTADELLQEDVSKLNLSIEGFNGMCYAGTQTKCHPTDFRPLMKVIKRELKDSSVRAYRNPNVVFEALQVLNRKFSGKIDFLPTSFPDQYFTCAERCLSCNSRCIKAVNHVNEKHECDQQAMCQYRHQLENKVYLCRKCVENNKEDVTVVPKAFASKDNSWLGLANYAWSGYVLECKNCGIIYRSRQYWYGNEEPDKKSVTFKIRHVWPGEPVNLQGSQNAARRLVEGLGYVADSFAKPSMTVRRWLTDRIAPPYWKPNAQILHCHRCEIEFNEELYIHHCRRCGDGFCDSCSSRRIPVPERGWGPDAVRVCEACFDQQDPMEDVPMGDGSEVTPRRVGEAIGTTVGAVASVVSYPLNVLKESSFPSYWVPDRDIVDCSVCKEEFGTKLKIHHCRACGQGVCKNCSPNTREVPSRGWDNPVRVCNTCYELPGIL